MSRGDNGEGSIYPYRSGFATHVWITTPAGRRQRKSVSGKTRAEVHEKWLRLHERARRGPVVPVSPRLRDFLEQWLAETVRPGLSPATASNYEMFTRLYIVPDLGGPQAREAVGPRRPDLGQRAAGAVPVLLPGQGRRTG